MFAHAPTGRFDRPALSVRAHVLRQLMLLAASACCVSAMAQPAPAATKPAVANPVEIRLERKKVVVADGKETLVSADSAKPGDLIEETATYTNRSKKTFRVEATLPVPTFTEFVAGTATPANAMASADGKTFSSMPLKRQVKKPNGVMTEEIVATSEYKSLRWGAINLAPEKQFVASARFRLRESSTAQPK